MRIFTVTCDGRAAAVVRAENPSEAIDIAQELGEGVWLRGPLAVREPNDAEMVSWLEHRSDHLLSDFAPFAAAS